jgi:putative transposase
MAKAKTPSFITEFELHVDSSQKRKLLVRMDAARQVYNACLGESLKRLGLLRQSKIYQSARKMKRGEERTAAFREGRKQNQFREYDLHTYAQQFNHSWLGEHLDSLTVQKIATRAFEAVQKYAFGKQGRPRFKGKNQLISVEGKNNASGIRWRKDRQVEWKGLTLEAIIDREDEVHQHGLQARVKYVRLLLRRVRGKQRFYVQLIGEGKPLRKDRHPLGKGKVGLDVGPSTVAVVGEEDARLELFCRQLEEPQRKLRLLQRKLERQRRANNPDNYHPDGRVKQGAREWHRTAGYRRTQEQVAEIHRQLAAYRKSLHGQLVNEVLGMGDVFQFEKLSYRAFQRQYGRSVRLRAPGKFIELLKRKAESAGAEINEYDPRKARHSQLCHHCGTVKKKPRSQRWHACPCGVVAQRDLYSAFLARCMEGDRLNADHAEAVWSSVDTRLQAALSRAQSVNGERAPSSFGLKRRQNRSPAILGQETCETQDVVPGQSTAWGEPAGARSTARTPHLFPTGC